MLVPVVSGLVDGSLELGLDDGERLDGVGVRLVRFVKVELFFGRYICTIIEDDCKASMIEYLKRRTHG